VSRIGWSNRLIVVISILVGSVYFSGGNQASLVSAETVTICEIQGDGYSSALLGEEVTVEGVVTLDLDQAWQRGFYIQHESCDGDANTSDGLFVYLGAQEQVVGAGDWVHVDGVVGEYYGLTEVISSATQVVIVSQGHPFPAPVNLNPPYENENARAYFETLEGMYVGLELGVVVGPTDSDDRAWLVNADLGIERVFIDDPQGTGELVCVDDSGIYEITPEVKVPDRVEDLLGVLDFRGGDYCLQLTAGPTVIPAPEAGPSLSPAAVLEDESFTLGTFNLANLFDMIDDEGVDDEVLGPTEYQRRLHKRALAIQALGWPDILALQEAENQALLEDLVAQPEVSGGYGVLIQDGPDQRGLDVALLYRTERVQALDFQARQGCTLLVDGLGPDGNGDVNDPQNEITCDSDGDGHLDGNRLFSRPPLVAHLRACLGGCLENLPNVEDVDEPEIWVIANHWKSKFQDTDQVEFTLPRRVEQAQFVAGLVDEILAAEPRAILAVFGDLNDHPNSQPLAVLESHGLQDLLAMVAPSGRYTYLYNGLSQVLDHLLIYPSPWLAPVEVTPLHANADYPYMYLTVTESIHRSSDHDPLQARFQILSQAIYMPLVSR
jgi:predicted extracellular nuclease